MQHQNKSNATLEQSDCNIRTKLLQYEMQDQKKETNATKKYYLLQHRNKATATKNRTKSKCEKSNIRKKKTNATKKNYLLQQQNKATATTRNKAQCEMQHQKKRLMQQRTNTCCNSKTTILQQLNTKHNTRCNIRKKTNATKKIYLLQQQKRYCNNRNKKEMRDVT